MKSYAPALAAGVIALTAMSGLINVNVQHNLHVPPELNFSVISSHREFSYKNFPYTTHIDINLRKEIKDTNSVLHIVQVLQNAKDGDVVVFHLAGFGGEVDSVILIANNIKLSKAFVIMSVEAPVYSGHAYLALLGDAFRMSPGSFLMFHESSVVDVDCTKQEGYDRGISNITHCDDMKEANVRIGEELLKSIKLLTPSDITMILNGNDLYLFPADVEARIRAPLVNTSVKQ